MIIYTMETVSAHRRSLSQSLFSGRTASFWFLCNSNSAQLPLRSNWLSLMLRCVQATASMSHPEAHTQILWAAAFPFPTITALSWEHYSLFCFFFKSKTCFSMKPFFSVIDFFVERRRGVIYCYLQTVFQLSQNRSILIGNTNISVFCLLTPVSFIYLSILIISSILHNVWHWDRLDRNWFLLKMR